MNTGKERREDDTGKLVKDVFCDSYIFYLKYHGKLIEPGMWEAVTEDFSKIVRKHGGANICMRLMLAAYSQLEEETR